jgi:tRNA dimethylallyltransferase
LIAVDPEEAERLHPNSTRYIIRALEIYEHTGQPKSFFTQKRKPERPLLMLGLWREKESTNRRINKRIKVMLAG